MPRGKTYIPDNKSKLVQANRNWKVKLYYLLLKEQAPVGSQSDHPHHNHWGHLPGRKHIQSLRKAFENLLFWWNTCQKKTVKTSRAATRRSWLAKVLDRAGRRDTPGPGSSFFTCRQLYSAFTFSHFGSKLESMELDFSSFGSCHRWPMVRAVLWGKSKSHSFDFGKW